MSGALPVFQRDWCAPLVPTGRQLHVVRRILDHRRCGHRHVACEGTERCRPPDSVAPACPDGLGESGCVAARRTRPVRDWHFVRARLRVRLRGERGRPTGSFQHRRDPRRLRALRAVGVHGQDTRLGLAGLENDGDGGDVRVGFDGIRRSEELARRQRQDRTERERGAPGRERAQNRKSTPKNGSIGSWGKYTFSTSRSPKSCRTRHPTTLGRLKRLATDT